MCGRPRPVFAIGLGFLTPIVLLMIAISPSFTSWLWTLPARAAGAGENAARLLLEGYRLWYLVLLAVAAVGIALGVGLSLLLIIWGVKILRRSDMLDAMAAALPRPEFPEWEEDAEPMPAPEEQWWDEMRGRLAERKKKNTAAAMGRILTGVWAAVLVPGLLIACVGSEDVLSLAGQAREDLEELEAGRTQTVSVWISPKSRPARLPGPYTSGQQALTTRYGVIGWDTGGTWVMLYVPDAMGFSLTGTRLYDENKSQSWNEENAQQFRVRYTSCLYVAVEITPIE